MTFPRAFFSLVVASLLLIAGCATRQVNPPIARYDPATLRQSEKQWHRGNQQDLVILAFSGGGTRAASFSYGVLEALRRIEIVDKSGRKIRLLDEVDVITGVSGGSFTALAYGLYGDKLFDDYETRFLKRDVQGELTTRTLNPLNWGALSSTGWGRSELAAQLYDEILFNGATFADLYRAGGPMIAVSATELAAGSRIVFTPQNFGVMCADLGPIRLSRAAAASSAVPVVLSPITINNYGGSCRYQEPPWLRAFSNFAQPPRPAARVLKRLQELRDLSNGVQDPYLHLVDGGISDNLGLRSVLDVLEMYEALHDAGQPTPLDHIHRIIIFVVNSLSTPSTNWNKSEEPPGTVDILVKAAGVPIDRYSGEMVEQLKDIDARWEALRRIRDSGAFAKDKDPAMTAIVNAPNADIYVIDVSFQALKDKSERDYLNQLPTSFVLPDEAVDRLRAAPAKIIRDSPDFQQMLNDQGAHVVDRPVTGKTAATAAASAPAAGFAQAQTAPTSSLSAEEQLERDFTDPLSTLPQVIFRDSYTPANYGPCTQLACFRNDETNQFIIRPIIPRIPQYSLLPFYQLIRPTFSLVTVPSSRGGTRTEFGDLALFDVAVLPWPDRRKTGLLLAVGPAFVFPTATSSSAGQGAWQAGPALGAIYTGIPGLLVGFIALNPISFAYTSPNRRPQNTLQIQPVLALHLWGKFYMRSAEATWTIGWHRHYPTTLPLSLGIGRNLALTGLPPMSFFVTGQWMAYRQYAPIAPQTTINFGMSIAFPGLRDYFQL